VSKPIHSSKLKYASPAWHRAIRREIRQRRKEADKELRMYQSGKLPIPGKMALGFHVSDGLKLPHGDGRKIEEGRTYEARNLGKTIHPGRQQVCKAGMHASPTPFDALMGGGPNYLTATHISYVLLSGITSTEGTKMCGWSRKHLIVKEIPLPLRMRIAFVMGGSGRDRRDGKADQADINMMLRHLLDNPEVFPAA